MKTISYEDFIKMWKDSPKEYILRQYYRDYKFLIELKNYRLIINKMTIDTYIEPNKETKRFIDEMIDKVNGD